MQLTNKMRGNGTLLCSGLSQGLFTLSKNHIIQGYTVYSIRGPQTTPCISLASRPIHYIFMNIFVKLLFLDAKY